MFSIVTGLNAVLFWVTILPASEKSLSAATDDACIERNCWARIDKTLYSLVCLDHQLNGLWRYLSTRSGRATVYSLYRRSSSMASRVTTHGRGFSGSDSLAEESGSDAWTSLLH